MHFLMFVITDKDADEDTIEILMEPYQEAWEEWDLRTELCESHGETFWSNPDGKWDWYSIGGRWYGHLHAEHGIHGERSWTNGKEPEKPGRFDACQMNELTGYEYPAFSVLTPDGEWYDKEHWVEDSTEKYGVRCVEDEEWDARFDERFIEPYKDADHMIWVIDYHN